MGKKLKNPFGVEIIEEGGIARIGLYYGLTCDEYPDLVIRKTAFLPFSELSSGEQSKAQVLMDWAISKMKALEGIS